MSRVPLSRILIVVAVMAVVAGVGGVLAATRHEGGATGQPQMASKQVHQRPAKYVALGSSFASGPSSNKRGSSNCGRSDDNYPHRVADARGLRLVDVTCAGSTTSEILRPSKRYRKPPQIAAVTPDTRLVTITSGGNDVGYIGRIGVQSCGNLAALGMKPLHCNPNRLPSPVPTPADFVKVERNLTTIIREIHRRAPHAEVLLVDYPPLVSPTEVGCTGLPLLPWQILDAQLVAQSLATVTARAAAETRTTLVKASQAGLSHTVCSDTPWLQGFPGRPPYHPTEAGKRGVAQLVIDALR